MKSYMMFAKVLSLNNCGLSTQTIIHECQHKLDGTYVFLNGEPIRIRHIDSGGISYEPEDNNIRTIPESVYEDDFEVKTFVPETGAYITPKWSLMMTKRVKKFYKKSFFPDAYHFSMLAPTNDDVNFFTLMRTQPQSIYIAGSYLYYIGHRIGEINGRTINVYPLYYNDVKEAIKRGSFKVQQPFHLS